MDYQKFVQEHVENDADITIAVQPASRADAPALGILKLAETGKIVHFQEKPKTDEALDALTSTDDPEKPYMASMGIYVFKTAVLNEMLQQIKGDDFGKNIIPAALEADMKVHGYVFDSFWEDIGTMRRFYEVNLMMAQEDPPFDFYNAKRPIYTRPRFLPGSEINEAAMKNILMADGCQIGNATLRHCVMGLRSVVGDSVTMTSTVMMGADYYESDEDKERNAANSVPNMGIGSGCVIDGAIIDKNARIGKGVIIRNIPDRPDSENDSWVSRDGLIIVQKNGVIADNTVI